jgi:short subunit dehydrogenase-like uncharacterized protein
LPPRVVLFGATGYTGRLAARELRATRTPAVLAGRDQGRLEALAGELGGGFEVAVADSARPASVRALVGEGDVLVTTVGPFLVHGQAAVEAAVAAGAHYLDAAGEPPFLRQVFEEHGPRAEGRCALVPAFGYDFVPGNLAGALALREAGEEATAVAVGYFASGGGGFSTGTLASGAGLLLERSFAWRGGRLVRDRVASRVRAFPVRGRAWLAVSYGGSEHYALPRLAPGLRDVDVYLGWFGRRSRAVQAAATLGAPLAHVPGAGAAGRALARALARRTGGGPEEPARQASRSSVIAVAAAADGRELAQVRLRGPNVYTLTGRLLAWGARQAAAGGVAGTGALGPVEAFGLEALGGAADAAGLKRIGADD